MKPITKDDLDIHTLRIYDRIEKVESRITEKIEQGLRLQPISDMQIFDNQDLMFLTRRCTRTLQICRSKNLLRPMYPTGKNYYTKEEIERFRFKVLPYLPEELSALEEFNFDNFMHEYNENQIL